ncbi:MAG: hypothetical protein QOE89_2005, partial [Pseudonocardiales bacterium]|nr:hypothetical protein [Pseudonocardiales bacterium]
QPGYELVSLQTIAGDWRAYQTMSLWLFHTPPGVLPNMPAGVPAVATTAAA